MKDMYDILYVFILLFYNYKLYIYVINDNYNEN